MTKKLLNKTLNYYFIYALVILISIGPAFYILSNILFEKDADEDLQVLKINFNRFTVKKLTTEDIITWNAISKDVKIENFNGIKKDTLFDLNFYDSLNRENEPFRVLQSPIKIDGHWYTFSARMNMVGKEHMVFSTVSLFIIILLLLIVGFLIITKIISKTIWHPFYVALDRIERFEIDKNPTIELAESSTEEFERLNTAIQNLIEKNTFIYKSQKEFIENAAHELQTPIAVFKGKLDMLLQRSDLTKEQFEILDNLNSTTAKLTRLNKNLLLLSKIESNQYHIPEQVVLNDIIVSQIDFFKEQAIAKNINISINFEQTIVVNANAFLSEIMIKNLFLNAINHNVENGKIMVILKEKSLVFSNTGVSSPLNADKLFERFSKINPSSKGNGLGLSIVKKIVDINSWNIEYRFENNLHVFEIQF